MDTELPGTSQLIVDVMDKDTIGSDDLIGSTVIDLEDRWFDQNWQIWGREFRVPSADGGDIAEGTLNIMIALIKKQNLDVQHLSHFFVLFFLSFFFFCVCLPGEKPRWDTKPIEKRTLYVPSNNSSQGVLMCWVDIMTPAVASTFPPEDVALPPIQMFEMRLVIWKARNVPGNISCLFFIILNPYCHLPALIIQRALLDSMII